MPSAAGVLIAADFDRFIETQCAVDYAPRLGERERVPDHSWLSRTRSRLPLEVHDQVFTWVLERLVYRSYGPADVAGMTKHPARSEPEPTRREGAERIDHPEQASTLAGPSFR